MKGVSAKYMRCFYISIAVPRMLYAADLFLVPENGHAKGTKGFINKLEHVQRQASLHVTRALRSTPTDAIDTCADLVPFHLLVKKVVHQAATCLVTLPHSHPLAGHCAQSGKQVCQMTQGPTALSTAHFQHVARGV